MNQYRRTLLLWALLLAICTVLFSSCIQLEEGNINITISDDKTSASDDATPDTPEESTPEPYVEHENKSLAWLYWLIGAAVVIAVGGIAIAITKKKKV